MNNTLRKKINLKLYYPKPQNLKKQINKQNLKSHMTLNSLSNYYETLIKINMWIHLVAL